MRTIIAGFLGAILGVTGAFFGWVLWEASPEHSAMSPLAINEFEQERHGNTDAEDDSTRRPPADLPPPTSPAERLPSEYDWLQAELDTSPTFAVQPGHGVVTGIVLDCLDQPIVGAQLYAFSRIPRDALVDGEHDSRLRVLREVQLERWRQATRMCTVSSADGSFRFDTLPDAEEYWVGIQDPRYSFSEHGDDTHCLPGQALRFIGKPRVNLRINATRPDGIKVDDLRVFYDSPSAGPGLIWESEDNGYQPWLPEASRNADGSYTVVFDGSEIRIHVVTTDGLWQSEECVVPLPTLFPEPPVTVPVALNPAAGALFVDVTFAPDGVHAPEYYFELMHAPAEGPFDPAEWWDLNQTDYGSRSWDNNLTQWDRVYRDLEPGPYVFLVWVEGLLNDFVVAWQEIDVPGDPQGPLVLTVPVAGIPDEEVLFVRLEGPAAVYPWALTAGNSGEVTVFPGADGRYALPLGRSECEPHDRLRIGIEFPEGTWAEMRLEYTEETLPAEVTLTPVAAQEITMRVSNVPPGPEVPLRLELHNTATGTQVQYTRGRFNTWRYLSPGEYRIAVIAQGIQLASTPVTLSPGTNADITIPLPTLHVLDVRFPPGSAMRGTLWQIDDSGRRTGQRSFDIYHGRTTLPWLPAGRYQLRCDNHVPRYMAIDLRSDMTIDFQPQ